MPLVQRGVRSAWSPRRDTVAITPRPAALRGQVRGRPLAACRQRLQRRGALSSPEPGAKRNSGSTAAAQRRCAGRSPAPGAERRLRAHPRRAAGRASTATARLRRLVEARGGGAGRAEESESERPARRSTRIRVTPVGAARAGRPGPGGPAARLSMATLATGSERRAALPCSPRGAPAALHPASLTRMWTVVERPISERAAVALPRQYPRPSARATLPLRLPAGAMARVRGGLAGGADSEQMRVEPLEHGPHLHDLLPRLLRVGFQIGHGLRWRRRRRRRRRRGMVFSILQAAQRGKDDAFVVLGIAGG